MMWCFAKINNQLSEIFFDENKNGEKAILGHCDVEAKEYKTKKKRNGYEKTQKNLFSLMKIKNTMIKVILETF